MKEGIKFLLSATVGAAAGYAAHDRIKRIIGGGKNLDIDDSDLEEDDFFKDFEDDFEDDLDDETPSEESETEETED